MHTRQRPGAVLLYLVILLSGCTSPGNVAPDSAGLKRIDAAALQALVDTTTKELLVPGAVVLLRTPQGEFVAASGTTQLGTIDKPGADTYFRIASNTKTMTAALVLQLGQEGKLDLGDPISKYVSGVPNGNQITLAQLLEMRSGLYDYTSAPQVAATIDRDPAKVWTPDELLAITFTHPPNFAPGAQYEYSNTNYALLGLVIEKVDGRALAESMHQRLFAPLGMRNTMLPASTSNSIPAPYSHGYLYGSSSVALYGEPSYTAREKADAASGAWKPTDYTNVNHSFAAAAGGVISTAGDQAIWIRALSEGRVLDARYQRLWRDSPQPEDPARPAQKYGYGIVELSWGPNAMLFHGGETAGYNSKISYDPASATTLIVWTNLAVSLDEQQTANVLWVRVLDQIYVVSPLAPDAASP